MKNVTWTMSYFRPQPALVCAGLILMINLSTTARAAEPSAGFDTVVQPFFENYCSRCHAAKKQEGKFRLDTLSREFSEEAAAQRWSEVMFRINAGEMPPADEPQPKVEEIGQVSEWISARISEGQAARMARRGPVTHYRLSRDEYANTVYDLLGVHFDARMPGALNEDPRWHGFDRIGSMLSLSPSHVNRYFRAAETVLAQAFPVQPPKQTTGRQEAGESRWLLFPSQHHGNINAREAGLYRICIQLSALPSFKGRTPRLSIWNNSLKHSIAGQDVVADEGEPCTVEFEIFLPAGSFSLINEAPGMLSDGHTLSNTPTTIVTTASYRTKSPTGYKLFDDEGRSIFPLLIVDWLEWEGPILTESDSQKRAGLMPVFVTQDSKQSTEPNEIENLLPVARECLTRFATRAWRRPATEAEIDRYLEIVAAEIAAGESFRSAYLAAMTGVLTSKNFYYLVEGSPTEQRVRLDDWELASRLSYFLWSSMPDDALFAAAEKGELHQPEVLRAHLQRMLADAKIDRFTDAFPQQWLQLHRVGQFPPDAELYPDYDKWLEQSMILETTGYFKEVFSQNLSIREFLASDWTIMNSRLAMHYHLPAPPQPGFQRVQLKPDDHRGGLLTQASILTLTSDGTRHRPVHRGVWVSEAIFGKTPPPPPPNVEPLAPTPSDQPKATIRQQLEAHATHATCASCHRKIDPLGFAFDNFDAIGRWRTQEEVAGGQGDNPTINASGALADGRAYNGPQEFKQRLAGDKDRFATAFVEQLATFALRRVLTIDDAADIDAISRASQRGDYRLRTLIENFVLSDLFQRR